jgi:hypothetical protein
MVVMAVMVDPDDHGADGEHGREDEENPGDDHHPGRGQVDPGGLDWLVRHRR